jgi:hypothetical protein
MKNNNSEFKKGTLVKSVFDTPLTKRGYLLQKASSITHQAYDCYFPINYIVAVLYLYGADFMDIHSGYSGSLKGKLEVVDYKREPSIFFTYRDAPLISRTNEVKIIAEGLDKFNYDIWYPYLTWPDPEEEKVRGTIDPILSKDKLTTEAKEWHKNLNKFLNIVDKWHTDFLKNYKGKHDFELKLYRYSNNDLFGITILDKKIKNMKNKKDILKRQGEYSGLLKAFAEYLYEGFLNSKKLFPKTRYEK